ncbi:hypothetical protein ACETK8_15830 [Brevundimonas staleyi]|uniref:Terminase large subunit gp17-like C-terminal domain-containing protein n=1 Tax=Brevundimonas staleyi TaxID=74326 RepID=A0ABW0FYK9_9CAUL
MIPSYKKTYIEKTDLPLAQAHEGATGVGTRAKWNGAKGDPADHVLQMLGKGPDGLGPVEMDVRFRAVQDVDLDEFFRGKECTAFWLPEVDTHESASILSYCTNRAGRFPEPDDRPENPEKPAYRGLWGDANTPTIGSWFQKEFYSAPQTNFRLHKQPPGYNPDTADGFHPAAENVANLRKIDPQYYRTMAGDMEEHDVRRLLQCKLTYGRMGKPVHPSFDETSHVSTIALEPDPELPVVIGVDVDFKGAAVFGQRSLFGQWRVFAEIVAEDSPDGELDVIGFADAITTVMKTRFPRCKRAIIVADPAGKSRSTLDRSLSWIGELQQRTKITAAPAPSNDTKLRRTALARPLKRRGGFLVDPACVWLNTALNGGFHYPKKGNVTSTSAKKNEYSSVGEACEYMCLGGEGIEDRAGLLPTMGLNDPGTSNVVEVVFD